MKRIKLLLASALFAVAAGCVCVTENAKCAYPETIDEGFVWLAPGNDLSQWDGATEMYSLKDGVLECHPERKLTEGRRGDLYTKRSYRNFVLRFEFCLPPNANNGLGVRMVPGKDAAYYGMCELQLLDDGGSWYYDAKNKKDKLKPYQYTGSVYGIFPYIFKDSVYPVLVFSTIIFSAGSGLAEVLISPVIAAIPSENPDGEMSKLHSIYAWGVVGAVILATVFLLVF